MIGANTESNVAMAGMSFVQVHLGIACIHTETNVAVAGMNVVQVLAGR